MDQIHICPKCKLVYRNGHDGLKCTDCGTSTIDSGFTEKEWYSFPKEKRESIKASLTTPEIEEERKKQSELLDRKADIILTSCPSIDGYRATQQFGLVFGECVFKSNFFKRLSASFDDLGDVLSFGDKELSGSARLISDAREYALGKMVEAAANKGANAIIGIDAESSIGGELIHVMIYGTAVKIEKIAE